MKSKGRSSNTAVVSVSVAPHVSTAPVRSSACLKRGTLLALRSRLSPLGQPKNESPRRKLQRAQIVHGTSTRNDQRSPKISPRVDAVDGPGIEFGASTVPRLYLHAGREGEHAYAVARDVGNFLARVQVSASKNVRMRPRYRVGQREWAWALRQTR